MYDPNQVYEITGVYGYATTIEFAPGEKILNKATGDSIGWEIKKFRNHLVVKPVEADARTNLTVTTSNHVYYFRLSSSKDPRAATYAVRFTYTNDSNDAGGDDGSDVSDASNTQPRMVNKNYEVSGDERSFGLQRVFDDGQFTYFLTAAGQAKPSIYVVDRDGTEMLENVRRSGPYLVVEQMADRFTLRDGDRTMCVKRTASAQETSVTAHAQGFGGSGH
ncbi:Forms the bulk of type IV secretion complex that spans outer membrane and periplasm (VirB9) [Caballeronia sordidicola]|uniref:Forms the bulk of type IV secretion complex that spans outer membrane and periplasm (VirB9) n=1 Tax=Caballeronia sordidicola TaxID=196367 RepID=A0A242N4H8_CABSO|nr:Forms the bulk of type IV secretion complex that spans outer membrane and periplasm (VirB9) [Caballeronia sordidicola]